MTQYAERRLKYTLEHNLKWFDLTPQHQYTWRDIFNYQFHYESISYLTAEEAGWLGRIVRYLRQGLVGAKGRGTCPSSAGRSCTSWSSCR